MKAGHTQCAEALCEVLRKKCKFIIKGACYTGVGSHRQAIFEST